LEPVSRESEGLSQQLTPDRVAPDVCLGFSARNRDGDALHEINEILERKDINYKHKAMILGENAKRFYNL
jgi:hypothetical protein